MSTFLIKPYFLALSAVALASPTAAIAQTKDHAPVALPSARAMAQDKPGTESWTYVQPRSVFVKYRTVIVDPTAIYQGADAQFDNIDYAARQKMAAVVTDELRQEVAKTFPSPAKPQADNQREQNGEDERPTPPARGIIVLGHWVCRSRRIRRFKR